MDGIRTTPKNQPSLNPWLLILVTGIAPLLLFLFMFFKWYQDRTDFKRLQSQFIQRQNTVMAYDAMEVSTGFGDLLEKAGRDVQLLGAIPTNGSLYLSFYQSQLGDFTRYDTANNAVISEPLPFYNQISFFDLSGARIVAVHEGKLAPGPLPRDKCLERDLCDRKLLDKLLKMPVGSIHYGKTLRYYSTENETADDRNAGITVGYRGKSGVHTLRIDYRHLRDHLTTPSFPYDPKRDLIDAYKKGNYLFIVDGDLDIITHPAHSRAVGIIRQTGEWATPMETDADTGTHPINIRAYRGERLKNYFHRLLTLSFEQKGVDIFQAPNLEGTKRILSVAPIFVSKGQFKDNGIFGHVIVTCNLDYFEEPKEAIVPYY